MCVIAKEQLKSVKMWSGYVAPHKIKTIQAKLCNVHEAGLAGDMTNEHFYETLAK
jgi:hypothetical protein